MASKKRNPFMKPATSKPMISKKASKGESESKKQRKLGAKSGC